MRVCCCAIPVCFSWLVGFERHATESRRVASRRRLGQNVGQRGNLFGPRRPTVSFLSQGQKRAGFGAQNSPKWTPKQLIFLFGACLAK